MATIRPPSLKDIAWFDAPEEAARRHPALAFAVVLGGYSLLLFIAYFSIFLLGARHDPLHAAKDGLINALPVFALGFGVRGLLVRFIFNHSLGWQAIGHLLLGGAFALIWYWTTIILVGALHSNLESGFLVSPFFDSAQIWQLIQGFTLFCFIAAMSRLGSGPALDREVPAGRKQTRGEIGRLLIRDGEEIRPLEVSDIVTITGADDYSEVATVTGRHLVRMNLGSFEESLASDSFVRVHRSSIINVNRLVRAEPAGGGRILLHMENGETVPASRNGAKLLRSRIV